MSENADANRVALSFVDLLYAVPVAALATRIGETNLKGVGLSGWSDIALALVALTLGWIGHHANRLRRQKLAPARRSSPSSFTGLGFVQFWFEVFIIGDYFALSTRLLLPGSSGVDAPQLHWKGSWLLALFVLYLCWDLLDITIAHTQGNDVWRKRACWGATATASFVVIFGVVRLASPAHADSTFPFDAICIVALWVYRAAQQRIIRTKGDEPAGEEIHVVTRATDTPELFLNLAQAAELVELRNGHPSNNGYKVRSVELNDAAAGRKLLRSEGKLLRN